MSKRIVSLLLVLVMLALAVPVFTVAVAAEGAEPKVTSDFLTDGVPAFTWNTDTVKDGGKIRDGGGIGYYTEVTFTGGWDIVMHPSTDFTQESAMKYIFNSSNDGTKTGPGDAFLSYQYNKSYGSQSTLRVGNADPAVNGGDWGHNWCAVPRAGEIVSYRYTVAESGTAVFSFPLGLWAVNSTAKLAIAVNGTIVWPALAEYAALDTWYGIPANKHTTLNELITATVTAGDKVEFLVGVKADSGWGSRATEAIPRVAIYESLALPTFETNAVTESKTFTMSITDLGDLTGAKVTGWADSSVNEYDVAEAELTDEEGVYSVTAKGKYLTTAYFRVTGTLNGLNYNKVLSYTFQPFIASSEYSASTAPDLVTVDTTENKITYEGDWDFVAYDSKDDAGDKTKASKIQYVLYEGANPIHLSAALTSFDAADNVANVCWVGQTNWGGTGGTSPTGYLRARSGHVAAIRYTAPKTGHIAVNMTKIGRNSGSWAVDVYLAIYVAGARVWPADDWYHLNVAANANKILSETELSELNATISELYIEEGQTVEFLCCGGTGNQWTNTGIAMEGTVSYYDYSSIKTPTFEFAQDFETKTATLKITDKGGLDDGYTVTGAITSKGPEGAGSVAATALTGTDNVYTLAVETPYTATVVFKFSGTVGGVNYERSFTGTFDGVGDEDIFYQHRAAIANGGRQDNWAVVHGHWSEDISTADVPTWSYGESSLLTVNSAGILVASEQTNVWAPNGGGMYDNDAKFAVRDASSNIGMATMWTAPHTGRVTVNLKELTARRELNKDQAATDTVSIYFAIALNGKVVWPANGKPWKFDDGVEHEGFGALNVDMLLAEDIEDFPTLTVCEGDEIAFIANMGNSHTWMFYMDPAVTYEAFLFAPKLGTVAPVLGNEFALKFSVDGDEAATEMGVIFNGTEYAAIEGFATIPGIAAKKMGDAISVTPYAKFGTSVMQGTPTDVTFAAAVKALIAGDTATAEEKAYAKAALNYGAALQTYFKYNTDALVNEGVEAVAPAAQHENVYALSTELGEDPDLAIIETASVLMGESFSLKIVVLNVDSSFKLQVADNADFTDPTVVSLKHCSLGSLASEYKGIYTGLTVDDLAKTLYIRVVDSDGEIMSETLTYSIVTYAMRIAEKGNTDLANAILALYDNRYN